MAEAPGSAEYIEMRAMMQREFIVQTLTEALQPQFLAVTNESHQHNVPANSETHFKVVCVCEVFAALSPVKRHQHVYGLLAQALTSGVHALALHLYSPEEWSERGVAPSSPPCLGGSA